MRNMFRIVYSPVTNRWIMQRSLDGGEWFTNGSVSAEEVRHIMKHCDLICSDSVVDDAGIAYGYMAAKFNVFSNACGGFERLR